MAAAGRAVPALEEEPSAIGYEWVIEAFWELSSCRSYGMSPGPIPWTAIHLYAQAHAFDDESTWWLHNLVRYMDGVWLKCLQEENERGKSSATPRNQPGVGRRQHQKHRGR